MAGQPITSFKGQASVPDDSRYRIASEAMGTIVIFGVTGDLAGRKLLPAIYNLWAAGFLPRHIAVVGVARRSKTDGEYRAEACDALKKFSRTGHGDDDQCTPFVSNVFYHAIEFSGDAGYDTLARRLSEIEEQRGLPAHRLYYLATAPDFFAHIIERLGHAGLMYAPGGPLWSRIVVEKPFGSDLESARLLNQKISAVAAEDQIYRIDHYLGKETVQNVFAFRFGNAIFEPLFNQKYVDHVQITVAETVGMEGRRGEFYDKTGALRDVVQNHALQLLSIIAMEPPASFNAKEIRDEKLKALSSVDLPDGGPVQWAVRGQYTEGPGVKGYFSEEGVRPESATETYAALRVFIDNWRWAGVPFFIRTGKRLKSRITAIAIQFKQPPTHYFKRLGIAPPQANTLVFRIQPDEAISLSFNAKPPGMDFLIQPVDMDFRYGETFRRQLPEAYERLLLDALRGDSTLFMRSDEVESAWRIITEVLDACRDQPPELYRPGTWGPTAANRLFDGYSGAWRNP